MTRKLTEHDRQMWARVARSVRPLRGVRMPELDAAPLDRPIHVIPARPERKTKPAPAEPADLSTQRRVRRGQAEVEARLDLHGHTQDSAYRALAGFLAFHHAEGARCVLVITGKGRLGTGILRARFLDWIAGPDLRVMVSGYSPAHMRHGGDGAFYVMLRARRR
jgi:DNA-nicking Smr family endonuclease